MPRGQLAEVGTERQSKNGYWYTKVDERGWVLTHWLTMEQHLGREIASDEMVKFKDKKAKAFPKDLKGLVLIKKKTSALRKRKADLEVRIQSLQSELDEINEQLGMS